VRADGGVDAADGAAAETGMIAAGDAEAEAGESTVAFLRIAQFARGIPAADFCVAVAAPSGAAYRGPLLAQLGAVLAPFGDAGVAALSLGQVSTYFTVRAEGALDLRLVAPGATGCDVPLPRADDGGAPLEIAGLPPLRGGAFVTLLVLDVPPAGPDGGGPWVEIVDDHEPTSGAASLRAVNALAGAGPLDFGFGAFDGGWASLFTGVEFGAASHAAPPAEGVVDPNGYLPVAPFDGHTVSARASTGATGDTAVGANASVPLGAAASLFAVDVISATDAGDGGAASPALLLCVDNGTPVGVLDDCTLLR
jgi:hypothetical protein